MLAESTFFEANCYLTQNGGTYRIGDMVGKSMTKPDELVKNKDFTDQMFGKYQRCMNVSGMKYEDDSKIIRKIKFYKNHHGFRIIVWSGQNKPAPEAFYCSNGSYILNMECLIYINTAKLFIVVLNKYLESCDDKELHHIVDGNIFSSTITIHDELGPPQCSIEIKFKRELKGIYLAAMKDCPPGYITCEMSDSHSGHFLYVKKEIIAVRGKLTKADIIQVD
jgi:hypothetical protein